ncbi:hypothetical protein JCM6882_006621 [Rhodosporidiobolus microsporus]
MDARRTTPVSLPLTNTFPQPGTSILPSSISNFVPGHHPHSSSLSSLSSFAPPGSGGYLPSASHSPHASLSNGSSPYTAQTNHTRVLLLADFPPSLKTKDLQEALSEWQDEPGGLKVKWRDDTSAWVVFGEPAVAKRAFLSLVTAPPPSLSGSATASSPSSPPIKIEPYTGPDVAQILQAVQNRPRSRSIAGQGAASGPGGAAAVVGVSGGAVGGHSRKGSLLGSGGGSALGAAIASAQAAGPHGAATSSSSAGSPVGGSGSAGGHGQGHCHARSGSWQRSSLSSLGGFRANLPSAGSPTNTNGGGDGEGGRSSPETPGAPGSGIVAGEAPRRFGNAGSGGGANGHQRRESRSGSDSVAASVAGLTIKE